ncbi:MAG TPA: NAD(P)/FAD-dependent oxidoreductase [Candidatus Sulfotelmatobacter sp.]|nr:NAD(P)/FAD-dependent oxidoreductase [Candidatus Sulfotelmatobacter sp.]
MGNQGTVTLVGAGLVGPLLAMGLVQRGFEVEIYERRPDMRKGKVSAGRSINLALSTRGIHALAEAGLWDDMQQIVVPMRGRMMHSVTSALTFQRYGKDDTEVIHSISRADLNIALINAAEARGVKIFFQRRCAGLDAKEKEIHFRDEQSGAPVTRNFQVAIGCDGSASAIRNEVSKLSRFNFSQQYLDYGYKELTIPSAGGSHVFEKNALHIWPRGKFMLIALPNLDGTFACILFLPFEGADSFAQLGSKSDVVGFFQRNFPDACAVMPGLVDNFFANPTGSMVTIKCSPWHIAGQAMLLGDAAHAIVPFFGQGINCGFEDCTTFFELLDRFGDDWARIFPAFESARKANTDAIADLAVENFVEMRDRVSDPRFLFRKKVELALQEKYPFIFVPKYSMVTFHRIPYATALERGQKQDRILDELCERVERIEDLDWNKADRLIHSELEPLEFDS